MEWFALLIPIIGACVASYYFHQKVVWWEVLLPMLPPLILIPVVKITAETALTSDKERWGAYIVSSTYYEAWDEYIHQACTRTVSCGKDCTTTETYDCSYVDYHPEKWEVKDNLGRTHSVKRSVYKSLVNKFDNEKFVDMHRHYHFNDGDAYTTTWPGGHESMQPWFTEHRCENRVQATNNIFKFPEIENPEELGLYDYPPLENNMHDPAILGQHPEKAAADIIVQKWNAKFGKIKQARVWMLLFHDKPRETGHQQESYWQGGNKNEFVMCVGLDKENNVLWSHNFCWSPDGNTSNDELKINLRDYIEKQESFKLKETVNTALAMVEKDFQRKEFEEFSYISVPTPNWAIVLCYVLTLLSTVGVVVFIVQNDVTHDSDNRWPSSRYSVSRSRRFR